MELCLSPVPRVEAFALPGIVERATSKPTPMNIIIPHQTTSPTQAVFIGKGMRIYTSRRHLPLLSPDNSRKLRSFYTSRTKRFANAFLICRDYLIPTQFPPRYGKIATLGLAWTVESHLQKYKKNNICHQFIS